MDDGMLIGLRHAGDRRMMMVEIVDWEMMIGGWIGMDGLVRWE